MRRTILSMVLAIAALAAPSAMAQLFYTRTSFTSTYGPISVAGGATAITFSNADDVTTSIPLPFTLSFAGAGYGTPAYLAVCMNGYPFPSANSAASPNTSISKRLYNNIVPNARTLAPWWDVGTVGTNLSPLMLCRRPDVSVAIRRRLAVRGRVQPSPSRGVV